MLLYMYIAVVKVWSTEDSFVHTFTKQVSEEKDVVDNKNCTCW